MHFRSAEINCKDADISAIISLVAGVATRGVKARAAQPERLKNRVGH